jgi:hypothetical protein
MEGWGPDCHKWTGASMARPAEKCGPTIFCPPNPFGTIHLLTCLPRVFQRSHYCRRRWEDRENGDIIGSTILRFGVLTFLQRAIRAVSAGQPAWHPSVSRAACNSWTARHSYRSFTAIRGAMEAASFAEASTLPAFRGRSPSGRYRPPCGLSDEPQRSCRQCN